MVSETDVQESPHIIGLLLYFLSFIFGYCKSLTIAGLFVAENWLMEFRHNGIKNDGSFL